MRNAASQIASGGLTDDVVHTNGADPSQRQNRRDASDSQSERKQDKKRPVRNEQPAEDFDDEADEFEDDADDGSQRDSEEPDDNGDDASEAEGEEGDEEGDEPSEGDEEPDDAKHLVKVQGKTFEVTLDELKAGYQRNRDYQLKTHALAKNARELIDGHKKTAEKYQRELVTVSQITVGLKKLIAGDMNSQQMQHLRATDPAQWAVQRELYGEKLAVIDQVIEGLSNESKKHLGELEGRTKADLQTLAHAESDKLVSAIPDWYTPNKPGQKNGATRVVEFLTTKAGFTEQEISQVYDARMLIIADYARRFVEYATARSNGQRKPVAKVPKKVVKPGQTQIRKGGEQQRGQGDFRRSVAQAKKTGTTRDAGRAIAKLI